MTYVTTALNRPHSEYFCVKTQTSCLLFRKTSSHLTNCCPSIMPSDSSLPKIDGESVSREEVGQVDAPLCRVCHCESEPNRELYYPCKCDGSIKYIHQDCLQEWLKHARQKTRCELCGEEFKFRKIYKSDIPVQLTIIELLKELFPRVLAITKLIFQIMAACISWAILLPVFASAWLKMSWCIISETDISVCYPKIFSVKPTFYVLINMWYGGVMNICLVGLFTFCAAEVLRVALQVNQKCLYTWSALPYLPVIIRKLIPLNERVN